MRASLRLSIHVLLFATSAVVPAAAQTPDFYDPAAYRSIYLQFNQTNYWAQLVANYGPEIEIPADMTVDGVMYASVGVRFRGNTSYTQLPAGSQKMSFNIRTDSFVPGQEILGYDHLNLNNGFHDPTFLREFLTYMIMRQYGPAPRCNFVKLYINGVYWGVYINVQQPNKDMMAQWFRSNEGNRYRCFPTSGGFQSGQCAFTWLGSNVSSYLASYQAKQGDGVDLMNFCNILNNTPAASLMPALNPVFSVDSFYRYAAVMNICTNTDSYLGSGKDHYLYKDPVYGQFHVFPFDLNEALAGSTTLSHTYNTTLSTRPAFTKTFVHADNVQRYIAHYRNILEDTFDWNVIGPIATSFHNMINADVAADTKKIYTYAQFLSNLTAPVTTTIGGGPGPGGGTVTIPGFQPLFQNRRSYLLGLADFTAVRPTLANPTHSPAAPTPLQPVTFTTQLTGTATAVNLYYRATGPFAPTPMFDDGLHGDGAAGDGVYGVVVGPFAPGAIVEYYTMAVNAAGRQAYAPRTAEHLAPSFQVGYPQGISPIRINEFLAQNTAVVQDPQGEWADYVELYNASDAPVNLGGMYLTDNLTNPTKFQLSSALTIAPRSALIVWCDEDGVDGPEHANFKLSSGGEAVSLFAADGLTQFDQFVFGAQTANVSCGRVDDGYGAFVTFPVATPGAPNLPAACGFRLYSAPVFSTHTLTLTGVGSPAVGGAFSLDLAGGPAAGTALLLGSFFPAATPVFGTNVTLLVDAGSMVVVPVTLDASGAFTLPITLGTDPALAGGRLYAQVGVVDGTTVLASNAVEATICP